MNGYSTSRLSVQAMKQFHPDVLATVQAKALFSKTEENLLGKIASVSLGLKAANSECKGCLSRAGGMEWCRLHNHWQPHQRIRPQPLASVPKHW